VLRRPSRFLSPSARGRHFLPLFFLSEEITGWCFSFFPFFLSKVFEGLTPLLPFSFFFSFSSPPPDQRKIHQPYIFFPSFVPSPLLPFLAGGDVSFPPYHKKTFSNASSRIFFFFLRRFFSFPGTMNGGRMSPPSFSFPFFFFFSTDEAKEIMILAPYILSFFFFSFILSPPPSSYRMKGASPLFSFFFSLFG